VNFIFFALAAFDLAGASSGVTKSIARFFGDSGCGGAAINSRIASKICFNVSARSSVSVQRDHPAQGNIPLALFK
jgi:hypothetical protein